MHTDFSIPDALEKSVRQHADYRAISFQGDTLTFSEFAARVDRVATGLAKRGIQKGDRVALYCINSDAFAIAYFGILKAGGIVTPINILLNPREIAYVLNDAGARALLYYEAFAPAVEQLRKSIPSIEFLIYIGEAGGAPAGVEEWSLLLSASGASPSISFEPANDVAAILYTSGTTGYPKGAMLTHANLVANASSVNGALPIEAGRDAVLVVLPMFHAFAAMAGMIYPLLHGCALVPLPRFDPEQVANTAASMDIAMLPAVPSMYNLFLRLPEKHTNDFSRVKYFISGGAAMPVEIMKRFEARFGKPIYEGDGPTECSPVTCVNPVGGERKAGSVGLPVPGVEMKILDEQGHELPCGEVGEICVRGANVMKGYWNRPRDTAHAFFGEWFRTGDLGNVDKDGFFYIVDRKKDMIIVNGMNVYPRMVEEILYQHPAIREAAVIGEKHRLHGEIPIAYISLKEGEQTTQEGIRAFCREHLGIHEIPKKVHIIDDLPKTAAGKILKRALRKDGETERGVEHTPST